MQILRTGNSAATIPIPSVRTYTYTTDTPIYAGALLLHNLDSLDLDYEATDSNGNTVNYLTFTPVYNNESWEPEKLSQLGFINGYTSFTGTIILKTN